MITLALSTKQIEAATMEVAYPQKSQKEIANIVGVHRNSLGNWQKEDEYANYKTALAVNIHKQHVVEVLNVLRRRALDDEFPSSAKHMELLLKSMALLTDRYEVSTLIKQEKTEQELLTELEAIDN